MEPVQGSTSGHMQLHYSNTHSVCFQVPPAHAPVMDILLQVLWALTTTVSQVLVLASGNPASNSNDTLWDGQDCRRSERTCCDYPNLPWFCKKLPEPTTDDLEFRICGDQSPVDEDDPINLVQLYIQ